jgi:hypothetical protein
MHIKTMMSWFVSINVTVIKEIRDSKDWQTYGEREHHLHIVGGNVNQYNPYMK